MILIVKFDRQGKTFYINELLKINLDFIIEQVHKHDWDFLLAVDGTEGSGKSTLAQQMAIYCDPNFCASKIAFTPNEFKKKVVNASKGDAIIWDEAMSGANVRATISNVNKSIIDLLAEIRQKNLFIFVVLPSFFDLDKYIALWRARALVHVYHKAFKRGHFSFYNETKKKYLYIMGKKFYSYRTQSPNFRGNFLNGYAVDEAEYRKAKYDALRAADPKSRLTKMERAQISQRDCMYYVLKEQFNWSARMIKQELDKYGVVSMSEQAINKACRGFETELENNKIT